MPVKINGATSGGVTLDVPAVAGTNTLTLPARTGNVITSADSATVTQAMLASGVAGNGPAFGVYSSASQTGLANGSYTKIAFDTKEFDTNANFNTSTYRFTPTVSGYYQINLMVYASASNLTGLQVLVYKNGSSFKIMQAATYTAGGVIVGGPCLINLNGSTDYLEFYALCSTSAGTATINASSVFTYVNGFLARAA